jgi:hypothetical protein
LGAWNPVLSADVTPATKSTGDSVATLKFRDAILRIRVIATDEVELILASQRDITAPVSQARQRR